MTAPERLPGECPPHGERVRYESADRGPTEPACTCERVTAPEPTPYTPSDEADLGGLARVIDPAIYPDINRLTGDGWAASKRAASAVLRSRWLAAHDARVVLDYVRTKEIPRVEITNPERIRPFIAQQIAEARRDAFNEAADEVHVEARWAGETQRRGLHAYYRPEERLLMVERTLRACAAAETPDGGA